MLFIDEAYYLYRQENEPDDGQETIEILLQLMESQRENLVVILAGYKDRMDQFFQSNPGMGSRIAHHINFPDYSLDELVEIGLLMPAEQRYEFSPDAGKAFREYLGRRMPQPRFANARSVRNALERARLRQAARIVANPDRKPDHADPMRIEADDILQSRVFDDTEEEQAAAKGDQTGTDKTGTDKPGAETAAGTSLRGPNPTGGESKGGDTKGAKSQGAKAKADT